MNLETQLRDLNEEVKKDFSLLEFKKFCDKAKRIIPDDEAVLSAEERILGKELLNGIFYKKISVFETCRYDWEGGRFLPNEEELKYLKEYHEDFPAMADFAFKMLEEQSPHLIDSFKRIRKNAEEDNKKLGELLKSDEYRQKAEELLKKYKDKTSFSGDNSDNKDVENKFNEQITNLQNQIKDLENKQNQDSSLEKDHKYKKELERLKGELEELKRKNNQKTFPNSSEKKNDNFPYGGLIIGGIVLIIIVLLLMFFFFFHKKRINK